MKERFAQRIRDTEVGRDSLAIFWISQAGFVYKTPGNKIIYIDPYLSDCTHRLLGDVAYGFKRITPTPIEPEEVEADLVVCTHAHPDHLDIDALPILAKNPRIRFVGAPDCQAEFQKLGLPATRYRVIEKGRTLADGDVALTGIGVDHGALAPDALGVLLQVGNIRVWQVGDTAYRPDIWQDVFQLGIDVIIPPINGAYGNLDSVAAAKLAGEARARVAIPCHFWMFAEHGGDPAQFMEACKQYAPAVRPLLMSQTELFVYHK